MRILRLFFSFTVAILAIGSVSLLIGRELLLYLGINQVRGAARELRSLEVGSEFAQTCLEYGGSLPENEALTKLQLRFTSDKEYVLEAVCHGGEAVRKVFRQDSLPPLVLKVAGQSGIVSGQENHGVMLSILGRTGAVFEEDEFIRSSLSVKNKAELDFSQGPTTTCSGYGYACCNENYQVGQGDQQQAALDCPRSCYSQCADRPVVLGFNSDPRADLETNVVTVDAGDEVEFFYTVSDIRGDAFAQFDELDNQVSLSWDQRLLNSLAQWFPQGKTTDSLEKIVINFGDGSALEIGRAHV